MDETCHGAEPDAKAGSPAVCDFALSPIVGLLLPVGVTPVSQVFASAAAVSELFRTAHIVTGVSRRKTAEILGVSPSLVDRWCDPELAALPNLRHLAEGTRAVCRFVAAALYGASFGALSARPRIELALQGSILMSRVAEGEVRGDDTEAERAQQSLEEILAALRVQRAARRTG